MTLGGVIYLQSIAEKRLKGTTRRNLDMFHQLCGNNALARIVIGTTNWGETDKTAGEKREQQLAKIFWNTMIASGSKSLRFDKTERSARTFLDAILDQLEFHDNEEISNENVLRIQNELVVLDRKIPETAAGKELRYTLEQLLEMQKEEANTEKAAALSASLKRQIDELHISLPRKLYLNFFVSGLILIFFPSHLLRLAGSRSTYVVSTWCAYSRNICTSTSIRYYNTCYYCFPRSDLIKFTYILFPLYNSMCSWTGVEMFRKCLLRTTSA